MSLVEDYMNSKMVTRLSTASMHDVSKAMSDWKISSIAITDDKKKKVIGILTERDIQLEKIVAGSLMSTPIFFN